MGYNDALNLAAERLAHIPPETVCSSCGVRYEKGEFFLPWFNKERSFSSVSDTYKILWLHYLTAGGSKKQSGRLIAYREVAPALFYEPNFYKRAVKPLADCFGKNPENLITTGESLGGKKTAFGDAAVTINVLPYLPVTFIIWAECEEFPPDGNILFDQTAKTWFDAEDLAVLASAAVYELIGAFKSQTPVCERQTSLRWLYGHAEGTNSWN
ncbi:MAG: DUF3786 domain-containing protein [Treponema sp.]|jgi:hypothetical protein|nr:DUF3786 domain-containing protein [Treponema sp.]